MSEERKDSLEFLDSTERAYVLGKLLDAHPELREEAGALSRELLADIGPDEVADDVAFAVTTIDPEDLDRRAGTHRWGYVDPIDASWELLEEALEPFREDMRRRIDAGQIRAAEAICVGIVLGLHAATSEEPEGPLEYSPDFPEEEAVQTVTRYFGILPQSERDAAGKRLLPTLLDGVPEWSHRIVGAANDALGK